MTSSPETSAPTVDALPPALASMWRLFRLGYRHEPRLLVAAFVLSLVAALPDAQAPGFVEVHRLSGVRGRSLDIAVVCDLMIHDLDVLLAAIGSEVTASEAVGVPVLSRRDDIANARLRFEGGCIANVTASRISRDRVAAAIILQSWMGAQNARPGD